MHLYSAIFELEFNSDKEPKSFKGFGSDSTEPATGTPETECARIQLLFVSAILRDGLGDAVGLARTVKMVLD
ncbi:MAG: hypothetical protein RL675_1047, partial [Bacteroidota bacterium]